MAEQAEKKRVLEQEAKTLADQRAKAEDERKARAKKNPETWAIWEETDHDSIRIVATRENDAIIKHGNKRVFIEYLDMPDWLRTAAQNEYREDGEAKGQLREIDGKIYDLRKDPAGWVSLPTAEVIQILKDGYLMIDERSLYSSRQAKAFAVIHNGFTRILNTGDRIRIVAMSSGLYTYETKGGDIKSVPVYNPGLPVGPLRLKAVTLSGRTVDYKPNTVSKTSKTSSDEPVGNGSGFFISEDGLFITNAHVVEDSTKIEVKTASGKKSANVLRVDKDKDLALLRVSVLKGTVAVLNISTNKILLGEEVFTIGFPLVELQGSRPKYTDGNISSLAGIRDNPYQMQVSVPVQPGNSGGPLADANGEIVGVIVSRLSDMAVLAATGSVPQNVNYAIKGTTLVQFLNENKTLIPSLKFGGDVPRRTQEEAIQIVEKASGLVLIY